MVKLDHYEIEDFQQIRDACFHTDQEVILKETNLELAYEKVKEKIRESFGNYQHKGSGYMLHYIERLKVIGSTCNPIQGSSYIPTPKWIAFKKAIINPENSDQDCFIWATLISLFAGRKKNPDKIAKFLRDKRKTLNLEGIEFPLALTEGSYNPFSQVTNLRDKIPEYSLIYLDTTQSQYIQLELQKSKKKLM